MIRLSMISRMRFMPAMTIMAVTMGMAGCYYPAQIQPPAPAKTRTVVAVPYDLTWDAVHTVVVQHNFKVLGDDPNHGIIEAEANSFTLGDADCGQMKSIANRYTAEPDPGGAAVYNFKAEPAGPESTALSVTATYTTPLHVPFRPVTNFQCVSRGTQEAQLLKEVDTMAHSEHRPSAKPKNLPPPGPESLRPAKPESFPPSRPGGPTLLGPDILKRPTPQSN